MSATPRLELGRLPDRIRHLPVARGWPVPWFVTWIDGAPDFRLADREKFHRAMKERRCWVCGQSLGVNLAFVLGPICGMTRTTTEPPCHLGCAEWSAKHCPFLARPQSRRRWDDERMPDVQAEIPILRNPGVTLIWVTHHYGQFPDQQGRPLLSLGPPVRVLWYAEGHRATRAQVEASVEAGLPALLELAYARDRADPWAKAEATVLRQAHALTHLYPRAPLGPEVLSLPPTGAEP